MKIGFARPFTLLPLVFLATTWSLSAQTFSNPAPITINDGAQATPYPSNILVSGIGTSITKVTISLFDITHSFPDDIDILLVGPAGQNAFVFSDIGGGAPGAIMVDITLDDAAAAPPPNGAPLLSGTFKPFNYSGTGGDAFPPPAPGGPYADPPFLSIFNGTNPNGTWSLYVVDDEAGDTGSIGGGWSITITAVPEPSTWMLVSFGVAGMAALPFVRRRKRSA